MAAKRPKNCISVKEAKELEKTWCKTRTPEIDKCMGFEDAREFEWSLEELQEYLNYVREESNKQHIVNPGIRVYFGAYPKERCKMSKGYATVFLAPTGVPRGEAGKDGFRTSKGNNYKIRPFNFGSAGEPPHKY